MEIKIHCSCGTRYAFEVEPVKNKDLPDHRQLVNGRPSRAEFQSQLRSELNSVEMKTLVLKESVSLWTLLWLFLGVGSAWRLGTGQTR